MDESCKTDSASQEAKKIKEIGSNKSLVTLNKPKKFGLFKAFKELTDSTEVIDTDRIYNAYTIENTFTSTTDEITEDEKKEFELDRKQIHASILKKINGFTARIGENNINSISLYRRIYRLLHSSICVDDSIRPLRVDRKITLNDEIIKSVKSKLPPSLSERSMLRVDDLHDLKKKFNNEGSDTYSETFWLGFFLRWIRLRDNFVIKGEKTLTNQSIGAFTEFYIDMFCNDLIEINYDQCPVFADVVDKNLRPDLCIGTKTNPTLYIAVIEVSPDKLIDEYHKDDVKLFKCMRKVLDHQLSRVKFSNGGVFGLLQGGLKIHTYYMTANITEDDEKSRAFYSLTKLSEKPFNLKRLSGLSRYYETLRQIEAQAMILTQQSKENLKSKYIVPPLRLGRGIIVNPNSRNNSPLRVSLGGSSTGFNQRDNRMEIELAKKLAGKLSDIKPSFHRGPNIKIAKYTIDGVIEEVILITKVAGDDREVQFLQQLDHPNIMHFFGSYSETTDDGRVSYILALERLRSVPISNNITAVLGYAEDIIKGIAYMHDQQIMHRDIKPSNIMFKPGPRPTCKLIDFNLSKRLENGEKCYTEDVGTDGFQAPEVLKVDVDLGYDFKSDIYSYGLTIKELSENCPKDQVFEETIQSLITKCITFDPTQRPSAHDIVEMLSTMRAKLN